MSQYYNFIKLLRNNRKCSARSVVKSWKGDIFWNKPVMVLHPDNPEFLELKMEKNRRKIQICNYEKIKF